MNNKKLNLFRAFSLPLLVVLAIPSAFAVGLAKPVHNGFIVSSFPNTWFINDAGEGIGIGPFGKWKTLWNVVPYKNGSIAETGSDIFFYSKNTKNWTRIKPKTEKGKRLYVSADGLISSGTTLYVSKHFHEHCFSNNGGYLWHCNHIPLHQPNFGPNTSIRSAGFRFIENNKFYRMYELVKSKITGFDYTYALGEGSSYSHITNLTYLPKGYKTTSYQKPFLVGDDIVSFKVKNGSLTNIGLLDVVTKKFRSITTKGFLPEKNGLSFFHSVAGRPDYFVVPVQSYPSSILVINNFKPEILPLSYQYSDDNIIYNGKKFLAANPSVPGSKIYISNNALDWKEVQ